jgi:hypothetical protein
MWFNQIKFGIEAAEAFGMLSSFVKANKADGVLHGFAQFNDHRDAIKATKDVVSFSGFKIECALTRETCNYLRMQHEEVKLEHCIFY